MFDFWWRRPLMIVVLCSLLGCGKTDPVEKDIHQAFESFGSGHWDDVLTHVEKIPKDHPAWPSLQLLAGDASIQMEDFEAALGYYESYPRDETFQSRVAALACAGIYQKLGELSGEIHEHEYVLKSNPDHLDSIGRLLELYLLTHQRVEADPLLYQVARQSDPDLRKVFLMIDPELYDPEVANALIEYVEKTPDDPALNFALATEDLRRGDPESAQGRLERAVEQDPGFSAAQALLGELLLERDRPQLKEWYAALPSDVHDSPRIWFVKGLWAEQLGKNDVATRCFWEAARMSPTSHRFVDRLAKSLTRTHPELGKPFTDYANALAQFRKDVETTLDSGFQDEQATERVIRFLWESGRVWEAYLLASEAKNRYLDSIWPIEILTKIRNRPDREAPRFLPEKDLFQLHEMPNLPDFTGLEKEPFPSGATEDAAPSTEPATSLESQ